MTRRRFSLAAEFERIAIGNKTDADKKAAQLEQECDGSVRAAGCGPNQFVTGLCSGA